MLKNLFLSKQSKSEIEYYLRNAKKNWKICINSKKQRLSKVED